MNEKREYPLDSFEIKQLIGEYGFVMKQLSQVKHEAGIMLSVASNYRDDQAKQMIDQKYGEGTAEFFACTIKEFYKSENISK